MNRFQILIMYPFMNFYYVKYKYEFYTFFGFSWVLYVKSWQKILVKLFLKYNYDV